MRKQWIVLYYNCRCDIEPTYLCTHSLYSLSVFFFYWNNTPVYNLFMATGNLSLDAHTVVWAFKGGADKQYNMLLGYMS